ncbi:MAG TPA: WYL domain-containing protein [Jiangellaceae bacterium]
MTAPPRHERRFALAARALAILADYPDGIPLADLAACLDTTGNELREEIRAYHAADVAVDHLGSGNHVPVIEFVAGPGAAPRRDDMSPGEAAYVRLHQSRSPAGVGAWLVSFGQLAAVAAAGRRLLAQEPQNDVLTTTLEVVATSVLAGATPSGATWPELVARRIRRAGAERRRVKITYALPWKAGTVERIIEPYRVIRTRRGWEVDAAVVGRESALATFVTSSIRSLDELPERFRRPSDIDHRIERHRRAVPVELWVPHESRWAVDLHAESADVLDEDEDGLLIRALFTPPVGSRLGLVLLAAGPRANVTDPVHLRGAGRELARALLAHHGDH